VKWSDDGRERGVWIELEKPPLKKMASEYDV
jgi:hypothetical protein